jgi:hypothetical protein
MPDDIYITTNSTENTPINITVSGDVDKSIYISTIYEPVAPVRSVNGKLGFVILDKNDIGLSNVENISITGVSGFLQYQIDNLDSGYASQAELNTLSGNLISTGSNLSNLIYNLSGFVTNQDVYLGSIINNTGIYLYNTIDSLSGSLNSTGQYLAYQINDIKLWTGLSTGLFYPLNENPANYLTGVDLSNYVLKNETGVFATKSELVATGIDLQNQIYNIYNSGFLTGVDLSNYYTNDNPSGYLIQSDLSPYLTGFNSGDYYLANNPSGFQTLSNILSFIESGQFNLKDTVRTTGNQMITGDKAFSYIQSEDSYFNLITQIVDLAYAYNIEYVFKLKYVEYLDYINYLSGINDINSINTIFNIGKIFYLNEIQYLRKVDYIDSINSINSGAIQPAARKLDGNWEIYNSSMSSSGSLVNKYYVDERISGTSGFLQSQLNNLDLNYASQAEFDSLSGKLNNSGSNLQNQINNLYSSGFITGVDLSSYYPRNNPSGFLTGVDLSPYVPRSETGVFALSIDLTNSGILLYNQTISLSGSLNSSGLFLLNEISNLNTSLINSGVYLDSKIDSLSGNLVNNFATKVDLSTTGVNLQEQLNNLNKMALAYAIAL